MTPDQWAHIKGIVAGALAEPDSRRPAYLVAHCANDDWTRHEAESLLASVLTAEHLYQDPTLLIDGAPVALHDAFERLAITPAPVPRVAPPFSSRTDTGTFRGTDRFVVRRTLGVGGMGIVYEVEDCVRHQIVALKTLRRWQAVDIYRLKHEFRTLASLAHPNLVSLHELVVDEDQCFFTMEFVDGLSYVEYVRESGSPDADRIRHSLPQLIDGVRELHRHGKLHRDIKPSNVLVTRDGRVVILDFGLTTNTVHDQIGEPGLIGTPAYLSPEQCAGLETTEASDWYGVGATLYHALAGRPPYDGSLFDVIHNKTSIDPPQLTTWVEDVPSELNIVCMALLRRDPGERMAGHAALELIRATTSPPHVTAKPVGASFVGRESSLAVLRHAFADVKRGRSVAVYIHGPSGIGKSALVQHFIDECLAPVVVLRSRCHEQESVPYKGLDAIIDGLSRYLGALPPDAAADVRPRDAFALARLFPVMQIEAIGASAITDRDRSDPVTLRRRAFIALRELFGRIGRRQPLVIEIDDFQWADADSAASLIELLRPPDAPPLLLVVSFRSEEINARPFLRTLIDQTDAQAKVTLELEPLPDADVAQLIDKLLPATATGGQDDRNAIARQAAGNPYLVEELARYAALGRGASRGATLHDMLQQRLASLPAASRKFVETLALCGRPMLASRIFEASGCSGDERPLVARLRSAHLVRSSRSPDHVEMYHDRIRETIAADVPVEARRHMHELLAGVLVAHGDDDPEALFEHYRAAGQKKLAARQAAAAAIRASEVLAFDRAAAFYRDALALEPDAAETPQWTVGLARSLENAGRPPEAADAYLAAATEAVGIQRIDLFRKSAEQLLMGGHIDRGLQTIHTVLAAVGMRLARGPRSAIASIVVGRARLAWRGLKFIERTEEQISQEDLLRIDTCWAIATGLMLVDTPSAASFNLKELLIALDAGEPYRIARALALEASFSVAAGGHAAIRRSTAFAAQARALAERIHHPHVVALSLMTAGAAAFLQGQWRKATDLCDEALTMFREQCTGVVWEMTLAQNFYLGSLIFRGQFRYACDVVPKLLQSARERGNLYFATELSTRVILVWLASDAADAGERQANEAMAHWSDSGFHRQHYNHFMARSQTALYRGDATEAWRLTGEYWPIIRRNMWLQVQYNRIETDFLRARAALAMAAAGRDVPRMCNVAEAAAERLTREKMLWSDALATLVRGTVAHVRGDTNKAVRQLSEAVEKFDRAEMLLYAAVARRRLATLVGGDSGHALQQESDAFMTEQHIRNASAMSRLIAPGFDESINKSLDPQILKSSIF